MAAKTKNQRKNLNNKKKAIFFIDLMKEEEKIAKIDDFKEEGYEYNEFIHTLIKREDIELPYDFILFCLLVEDTESVKND